MKKNIYCLIVFLTAQTCLFAQVDSIQNKNAFGADTNQLENITVSAFASGKYKDVPASIVVLGNKEKERNSGVSMVPLMNAVPGVRMEERSPGSYRLSFRGSLLRSPFGVRNIKIYLDDVPFTDATGNTYLNLIDLNQVSSIEVIKGPSSSYYGANTGGALILNTTDTSKNEIGVAGGSFGLFKESLRLSLSTKKLQFGLQQSHTQSDGYRQQSALRNDVVQAKLNWLASVNTKLSLIGFYADLHYETPGGITQKQMDSLPTLARQPAGSTPGAVQQNAGVYNRTYFGAATLRTGITKAFGNITSVVINHTDFRNPFITNYEKRKEFNYSTRTDFRYNILSSSAIVLKANAGGEFGYNNSFIRVYDNNKGVPGNTQYKDKVGTTSYFVFGQLTADMNKWYLQAGFSYNHLDYHYDEITDPTGNYPVIKSTGGSVSPRLGITYKASNEVSVYATAAKGFSPPTLAEILPSGGGFSASLKPEYGWNYELGTKAFLLNEKLMINASVYYFSLKDAIVRRTGPFDAEYYTNAGGTIQKGAEVYLRYQVIKQHSGLLHEIALWNSFSYQPYRFDSYVSGTDDFSGNKLTGIPRSINVSGADILFTGNLSLFISFNNTSSIPLNDANSVHSGAYHLLQVKISKDILLKQLRLNVYAGADNLLNETYSLGNDLNAFGGRYFNPAPGRNYYAGLRFLW